jgi:hypothetical protein
MSGKGPPPPLRRCIYCGQRFLWGAGGGPLNPDGTEHKCDKTGFRKAQKDLSYRHAQIRRDAPRRE